MNQPLLTVIVPCYNTANYLDKCISSIVGQTYSNLEILLINDGSTDGTGVICDSWKGKDNRIRVIHQQNEGLARTRRIGVANTTAEYITFVDSDDWIDHNMYTGMMSALLSTKSDIAQCGVCLAFEDGRMECYDKEHNAGDFEVIGRNEGVMLILDDNKWRSWMCNKIFKKNLFDHIVFPKDMFYEDFIMMHFLFHHASQSVYLNNAYYFYYQRSGSILNANTIQKKIKTDLHWAIVNYNRYLFVKQHPQYHKMLPSVKNKALLHGVNFLRSVVDYLHFVSKETFQQQLQQIKSIPFSFRDAIPFIFKLDLLILKLLPFCYLPYRKMLFFRNR